MTVSRVPPKLHRHRSINSFFTEAVSHKSHTQKPYTQDDDIEALVNSAVTENWSNFKFPFPQDWIFAEVLFVRSNVNVIQNKFAKKNIVLFELSRFIRFRFDQAKTKQFLTVRNLFPDLYFIVVTLQVAP